MKKFLQYTAASMLGCALVGVFSGLLFLIMIGIVGALGESGVSLSKGSVLHISLTGTISERSEEPSFFDEFMGKEGEEVQGLEQLIAAIRVAKENDNIDGIYLEGGSIDAHHATLEALRRELLDFKKSKKWILAYADQYTQGAYYLASVADRLLLNPSGMLDWHGIASQPVFWTGLLEKAGIKAQVFKVGTYKSAVEPYILNKMSAANREQVAAFIGDIWQGMVKDVAQSRKISADSLNSYANRYMIMANVPEYKRLKLVDALVYKDQVRDELHKRVSDDELSLMSVSDVATLYEEKKKESDKIAIYYATGDIVDSPSANAFGSNAQEIVGDQVVNDLDKLAKDEDIKAVVLRINSGGGSAYASEQMWRAIQLLKAKKPVVISMGDLAASGGYYMSCGANYIFAESRTLTGSIGIFGLIPEASQLLTEKLGLNFDVVKTNEASDFGGAGFFGLPSRPFNAQEGAALQAHVNRGYQLFITRVANGRTAAGKKMTTADVDKIGQGRVWTGNQALKIGLVDRLGSLDDAVTHAAKLAKVKNYSTDSYPAQKSWFETWGKETDTDRYMERKLRQVLGVHYDALRFVTTLQQGNYLQARSPYLLHLQ